LINSLSRRIYRWWTEWDWPEKPCVGSLIGLQIMHIQMKLLCLYTIKYH